MTRGLILLLVLSLFVGVGLVLVDTTPAEAHTPACRTSYPWIRYKVVTITVVPVALFRAYFYNASTGATHSHVCTLGQL